MIQINGKTYRNLQEQVQKNKEDIEELKRGGGSEESTYEFTDIETVTYDSTDGAKLYGKLHTITDDDEVISDATIDLPILPGTNITIDASETDDSLVIKNDIEISRYVLKNDYATATTAGLVKLNNALGLTVGSEGLFGCETLDIDSGTIANQAFVGKGTLVNKLTQYAKADLVADDDTLGLVKTDSADHATSTTAAGVLQAEWMRNADWADYSDKAFVSKKSFDKRLEALNLDDVTDETWTFTLADNTTVTKTVKVGS